MVRNLELLRTRLDERCNPLKKDVDVIDVVVQIETSARGSHPWVDAHLIMEWSGAVPSGAYHDVEFVIQESGDIMC